MHTAGPVPVISPCLLSVLQRITVHKGVWQSWMMCADIYWKSDKYMLSLNEHLERMKK